MPEVINAGITKVWEKLAENNANVLSPMYLTSLEQTDLVFVGMNPSFNSKDMKKWFLQNNWNETPEAYYLWSNRKEQTDEREKQTRKHFVENYSFFKQHHKLIEYLNCPTWCHLDLFPYRETNQNQFEAFLNKNPEFKESCLELFKKALMLVEPKMVLIWNARAARYFFEMFEHKFDEDKGTYKIKIGGRSVLVFASSMVTGQRALDVFSRERMFWHIKKTINFNVQDT